MRRYIFGATIVSILGLVTTSTIPAQSQKKVPAKRAMVVTTVTGPDAKAFIDAKAYHDKRFARHRAIVARKLAKKGFKPTERVAIAQYQASGSGGGIQAAVHRLWGKLIPTLAAQTAYTDGESPFQGMVIYESWDDGDNTTWEGMSYFENFDTGQAFSAASQEWTGGDTEWVIWVDSGGYDPPSDDPPPMLARWLPKGVGQRQRIMLPSTSGEPSTSCATPGVKPALLSSSSTLGSDASVVFRRVQDPGTPTSCPCPVYGWEEPIASCALKTGITRSWLRCGGIFSGCRWAGTLWKACGIACGVIAAAETITEGYRWHRDCVTR